MSRTYFVNDADGGSFVRPVTTQATGPSLRETLREVDAAIAEIIRAEVADPAERERLLAKLTALSQPAASPPNGIQPDGHMIVHVAACEACYGPSEQDRQLDEFIAARLGGEQS